MYVIQRTEVHIHISVQFFFIKKYRDSSRIYQVREEQWIKLIFLNIVPFS